MNKYQNNEPNYAPVIRRRLTRGQLVMLCSLIEQRINNLAGSLQPEAAALQAAWIRILEAIKEI